MKQKEIDAERLREVIDDSIMFDSRVGETGCVAQLVRAQP